jgi:hypothetical protein
VSTFEEIAARITSLREELLEMSRQIDEQGVRFERDIIPQTNAVFTGSESPAALRVLDALAVAYQAGIGYSSAVFLAAEDMRTYLSEM